MTPDHRRLRVTCYLLALALVAQTAATVYMMAANERLRTRLTKDVAAMTWATGEIRKVNTALHKINAYIVNVETALLVCLADRLPPSGAWPPAKIDRNL